MESKTISRRIRHAVFRPLVLSVFVLVGLWNLSVSTNLVTRNLEGDGAVRETLREVRNVNLHIQLRFYQLLTLGRPNGLRADDVTLVYIDDDVHLGNELKGTIPTSRAFLAMLIQNLSKPPMQASVIGLDIELLSPRGYSEGTDDASRSADNKTLLDAIREAAEQGVPVVLGGAFIEQNGSSSPLSEIFTESDLRNIRPERCKITDCPVTGYLNLPIDRRLLPPIRKVTLSSNTEATLYPFSLAVAMADPRFSAGAQRTKRSPESTVTKPIFGSFLAENKYDFVTALQVAHKEPLAIKLCDHRIVLIGGHWHDLQGYGDLVDTHLSPVGTLSGLGLHANYIESLLQHQVAHEPSLWVDIVIDLLLGLSIYVSFELAHGWHRAFVLGLAFVVPILCAYFFLVNANLYLDFLLPIELYFVHICYEMLEDYIGTKRHKRASLATDDPSTARSD